MREVLVQSLREAGYDVWEAKSGIDLLDLVETSLEDGEFPARRTMIVSDIRMRHLDGLGALESLRPLGIPVVLITAFGDDDTRAMALELGARALIDKPFDMDHLVEELERILAE